MHYSRSLLFALLPAVAVGQTFIVDAANGSGTNFLDLPAAVAAVPDGAVLIVRAGTYSGFTMSAKGVTILADPSVSVVNPISIDTTSVQQPITLRALNCVTSYKPIELTDCSGPVLIEGCIRAPNSNYMYSVYALRCAQLTLRECNLGGSMYVVDGDVVIESCTILGTEGYCSPGWDPEALIVNNGSVSIAGNSSFQGGDGYCQSPLCTWDAGRALGCYNGAVVRALRGAFVTGYGGCMGYRPSAVWVDATSLAILTPRCTLNPQTGSGPMSGVMPELTGSSAAIGSSLSATVTTEVGDLAILAVGLPGPSITIAGIAEPFWLDPAAHVFVAIGTHTAASPVTASVPVPSNPGFLGLRFNWQAACYGPITGFQATNPVVTLVH